MVDYDPYDDIPPMGADIPEDTAKAQPGTFKGFFLVRDSSGKPKFDDIFNIADEFWNDLTKDEQEIILQERLQHRNYSLSSN